MMKLVPLGLSHSNKVGMPILPSMLCLLFFNTCLILNIITGICHKIENKDSTEFLEQKIN